MASELKFNQEDDDDCFDFFNPVTKEDYEETVNRWSKAFIHLMELTATPEIKKLKESISKKNLYNKTLNKAHRHHKKSHKK
jgi:hypothetical protein